MSDWRTGPLGTFIQFQRGADTTRATQTPGDVPVVSSGGISSYNGTAYTSGPGVVIGRKGTLGKAFYLPGPFWPHDTTLWVKDFKGSHARFVYYFLSRFDVSWLDAGSANPTLNRNHLHPIVVTWPEPAEQQAIAEVLGALDDKIAANTALAISAEALAVSELSCVTKRAPLGELVSLRTAQLSPASFAESNVDHYSLPAFDAERLPVTEPGVSIKSAKFELRTSAVLLSKLNPRLPRIWRAVPRRGRMSVASTEFLMLDPMQTSPALLWAALAQPSFSTELDARVAGTSGSHQRVRPQDALSVSVIDPRAVPTVMAAVIDGALAAADLHRWENRTLAATRDALLPQLMSGKLRVRDVEKVLSDVGV